MLVGNTLVINLSSSLKEEFEAIRKHCMSQDDFKNKPDNVSWDEVAYCL